VTVTIVRRHYGSCPSVRPSRTGS